MLILKKIWSLPALMPIDNVPLTCNKNVIVKQTDKGSAVCDEKTGTVTPLDEMEAVVYSVLDEHIRNGTEILSDTALAAYVYIHKGLFNEEQWKRKINDMCTEVENMTDDMLPENWGRLDVIQLAYTLGGQNGSISAEGKDMIIDHAARRLIIEHMAADTEPDLSNEVVAFLENLWTAVKGLTEKNVLINTIHPINGCDNCYFFPNN